MRRRCVAEHAQKSRGRPWLPPHHHPARTTTPTSPSAQASTRMVQPTPELNVYAAFSEQLQRAQAGEVSLLDDDDGLLVRWGVICEQM